MRAERVLLIRSGRHLRVAMDALAARYPGCRIGVVGTPGSEPAIAQAGIAAEDLFVYPAPRIEPLAFVLSATVRAARRWRYDHVAILWHDPDGTGQGNVDRAAIGLRLRGYLAITPDGSIIERASGPIVRRELSRLVISLAVGVALGALLYAPARLAAGWSRMRRTWGGPWRRVADRWRRGADRWRRGADRWRRGADLSGPPGEPDTARPPIDRVFAQELPVGARD